MIYKCTCCGIEKPFTEFYADKRNTKKGVVSKCKSCCKEWQASYKKVVGYLPSDKARGKAWRDNNIIKARASEKKKRSNNKALYRAASVRYETAKLGRVPIWADLDKIKVVYKKASKLNFEVDHIVPLQSPIVSGLHVWYNLQLLEPSLNRSKSNKFWPDMPNG